MILNSTIVMLLMTFATQAPGNEPLELGSPVLGALGPGQRAEYQLEISSRSNVAFIVERATGSLLEPILLIRNASGATVGTHQAVAGTRVLRAVHSLQPGRYTVIIEASADTAGSYRLSALKVLLVGETEAPLPADQVEKNKSGHITHFPKAALGAHNGALRKGEVHRYHITLDKKLEVNIKSTSCFILKDERGNYIDEGKEQNSIYRRSETELHETLSGGSYLIDVFSCDDMSGSYVLQFSGTPYSYRRLWTRITMYGLVPAAYLGAAALAREAAWRDNPDDNRFGSFTAYSLGIVGGGALGGFVLGSLTDGGGLSGIGDLFIFGTIGIVGGIVGGVYLAQHYGNNFNTSGTLYYGSALLVGFFPAIVYRIGWD